MDSGTVMLVASGLIVLAYFMEALARRLRVPAVLFLIAIGITLRLLSDFYGFITYDFLQVLPTLGTAGLILIVFEGALEIDYEKRKNVFIRNAFTVAAVSLVITAVVATLLLRFSSGLSFHQCFVNAIPFSVVSSSIAIPAATVLTKSKREFVIYDSSFSDILGIVLFNYALANATISIYLFVQIGVELISVTVLSAAVCLLLVYMLKSIKHHVKFIAILAVLMFVYALGKTMHLSSLILVLMFGLVLNNLHLIKHPTFVKIFHYPQYEQDFDLLHRITAETVFFVKTFFFLAFGFIIDFRSLLDVNTLVDAGMFVIVIYTVRFVVLKIWRKQVLPELFYAPRGLISILLYLSVPVHLAMPHVNIAFLFVMVLVSSLITALGRFFPKRRMPRNVAVDETLEAP